MSKSTEGQFQEADDAIQQAVTDFMSRIDRLILKMRSGRPGYCRRVAYNCP